LLFALYFCAHFSLYIRQNRRARIEQAEQDKQKKTGRLRQAKLDQQNWTGRSEQAELDRQNRIYRTG
jgi:hypothetical protein